jgi:AraC-like DNA-binding protein
MLSIFLSAMTTAIAFFGLYMVFGQTRKPHHFPLMLSLLCLGLLPSGASILEYFPHLSWVYIALLPILFYLLLPSIWFYHKAITSTQTWVWSKTDIKHFLPMLIAILAAVSIALLPKSEFEAMFFAEANLQNRQTQLSIIVFFSAMLLWIIMSLVYSAVMLKRTLIYKQNLSNTFANYSGKSVRWIVQLTFLLLFTLLYAIIVLLVDKQSTTVFISDAGVLFLLLILVWVMASNGIKQLPGFTEVYQEPAVLIVIENNEAQAADSIDDNGKYKNSALEQEHLKRIAAKIEHAIKVEKIHLDADINLKKLSVLLGEASQYISQTLSQHMHTTFFDYINQARIQAAMILLLEENKNVLEVAMDVGFSSRSSFYKAFKRYTGLTPSEYKKQNLLE